MNDPNLAKIIGKSLALPGLLLMIWLGAKLWDIVKKRGKNALEVDTQILDHQKHKPVPSSSSAVLEGTCQRLKKVLVRHPKVTSFFIVVSLFGGLFYWGFSAENKDQQPAESATNTPISSVQQQPATPPSQASPSPPPTSNMLTKAAEQGNADAQSALGSMYVNGKGVSQDDKQAVAWFKKAAEQGNAGAQSALGGMYNLGKGVPQDNKQAVIWYRKAAEQGDGGSQFLLGLCSAKGEGVPQNDKQAVIWYRKAAEQGVTIAQHALGIMYAQGKGVPTDYVTGYAWLSLSAAQGDASTVTSRDVVANILTPEQRSKAQALAAELQAKIDKQKK